MSFGSICEAIELFYLLFYWWFWYKISWWLIIISRLESITKQKRIYWPLNFFKLTNHNKKTRVERSGGADVSGALRTDLSSTTPSPPHFTRFFQTFGLSFWITKFRIIGGVNLHHLNSIKFEKIQMRHFQWISNKIMQLQISASIHRLVISI